MQTLNELSLNNQNDIDHFIESILINPENEEKFWGMLGKGQISAKQAKQMLNCLENIISKEADNPIALSLAGTIYVNARHPHCYQGKGFDYINRAASFGNVNATIILAQMYNCGSGVSKNPQEAKKLFEKIAEHDNPEALMWLGSMYQKGDGIPKNFAEAAYYYRRAFALSHEGAKQKLIDLQKSHAGDYLLQYQCTMVLARTTISRLYNKWPKEISESILNDKLITDKDKYQVFIDIMQADQFVPFPKKVIDFMAVQEAYERKDVMNEKDSDVVQITQSAIETNEVFTFTKKSTAIARQNKQTALSLTEEKNTETLNNTNTEKLGGGKDNKEFALMEKSLFGSVDEFESFSKYIEKITATVDMPSAVSLIEDQCTKILNNKDAEALFWDKLHNKTFTLEEEERLLSSFEALLSVDDCLGKELLPTLIGGLYTFTSHAYKDIQVGLTFMGKATALRDANTLYHLGVIYQDAHEFDNHLEDAAFFFRRSYALARDEASFSKLALISDGNPDNIAIQYQFSMAICPELINQLFEQSPNCIVECFLNDSQLTDKESQCFIYTLFQENPIRFITLSLDDSLSDKVRCCIDKYITARILDNVARDLRACMKESNKNNNAHLEFVYGVIHQNKPDFGQAAFQFRKAYVLSHDYAEFKLRFLKKECPHDFLTQYHCVMAIDLENIASLVKMWPNRIGEEVFNDKFLSNKIKYTIFYTYKQELENNTPSNEYAKIQKFMAENKHFAREIEGIMADLNIQLKQNNPHQFFSNARQESLEGSLKSDGVGLSQNVDESENNTNGSVL